MSSDSQPSMSAPDRGVVESLAKVVIAVAWSDDRVSAEEITCLKDVLFQFQFSVFGRDGLSRHEWGAFDLYLASPVTKAERDRLVEELRDALQTPEDQALALSALEDVIQADGALADSERQARAEIEASLESVKFGLFANLEKLIRSALGRRAKAMASAPKPWQARQIETVTMKTS